MLQPFQYLYRAALEFYLGFVEAEIEECCPRCAGPTRFVFNKLDFKIVLDEHLIAQDTQVIIRVGRLILFTTGFAAVICDGHEEGCSIF